MVAAGMGICFLPEFSNTIPGVISRPVVDPEVAREVSLVTVAAPLVHRRCRRSCVRCASIVGRRPSSFDAAAWEAEPNVDHKTTALV